MNPDEWQSREEWGKEEAQRRESEEAKRRDREREADLRRDWNRERDIAEGERRMETVAYTITITLIIVGAVDFFSPGILTVIVFIVWWSVAVHVIGKVKNLWIRFVLYILAPIALLATFMWLGDLRKEHLRREPSALSDY